jgi:hypothetical protein
MAARQVLVLKVSLGSIPSPGARRESVRSCHEHTFAPCPIIAGLVRGDIRTRNSERRWRTRCPGQRHCGGWGTAPRVAIGGRSRSGSPTYDRSGLKRRLYDCGLKERRCELCGQELWNGKRIGLILDHINGVRDDNRLENLRIVCPNCAAGLDTDCGRRNRVEVEPRACARCTRQFVPKYPQQRYCSAECGRRWDRRGRKRPGARRVERPAYEQLLREIEELGYLAVGRRYGVSDNAIRKWVRDYGRERRPLTDATRR